MGLRAYAVLGGTEGFIQTLVRASKPTSPALADTLMQQGTMKSVPVSTGTFFTALTRRAFIKTAIICSENVPASSRLISGF